MTEQKITIEDTTRAQVAEFLPRAMAKALASYREYMDSASFETNSNFSEVHKAAKVAISHIELLIKLAKWADLPDAVQGPDSLLASLICEAQGDVDKNKTRMDEDGDD